MRTFLNLALLSLLLLQSGAPNLSAQKSGYAASETPSYTADGKLNYPESYREWVYLTSGLGMNYNSTADPDHLMFDNVFVNPSSYKSFLRTGTWPDKTMFMLEVRGAQTKGSINKAGRFQTDVMGREVHIKDEARFPGKWAFFGFDKEAPADQIPTGAICYTCHQEHAAVDTTFVQFYPTLIGLAKKKGTLSANYLKDEADALGETGKK